MILARAAPLAGALLLAGCAPRLVWFGKSADRRHVVAVIEAGGAQRVRLDGRDGPEVLGVGVEGIALGPDGRHLAYPARRPAGWTVIHDGREGPPWEGLGAVVLDPSGEHVAYAAERGARWYVVRDGEAGPAFDAILDGSIVLGGAGRSAYVGERGGQAYAVVDGALGPGWDGIGGLSFSADGARVAYVARRGDAAFAVVDGVASDAYEGVAEVSLAPKRGRVAVVARREKAWRVIVDGVEGGPFARVSRLRWSPAGDRLAYAGKRGRAEVVVLDGVEGDPFEAVMPASLCFDATGRRFAFAAQREGAWRITADGREGGAFDEVSPPVFSDGGEVMGHLARRGASHVAVIDGREGPGWAWAGDLVLGPGGRRFAYLARRGERSLVVDDRGETALDLTVSGTLAFSRDGGRWGVVAGDASAHRLFIAVEGGGRHALDGEELVAAVTRLPPEERLGHRPDEEILRRWVAAELEVGGGAVRGAGGTSGDHTARRSASSRRASVRAGTWAASSEAGGVHASTARWGVYSPLRILRPTAPPTTSSGL